MTTVSNFVQVRLMPSARKVMPSTAWPIWASARNRTLATAKIGHGGIEKGLWLALFLFVGASTPTRLSGQTLQPGAAEALSAIPVKGRAPKSGYARDQFGQAWSQEDSDGCDTRNRVLQRDLIVTAIRAGTPGCVVLRGQLFDPYSGLVVPFERGLASSVVQIDHVVSLSNAWQTGAFQWTFDKRETFANDVLNLLAVSGRLNQQKRDGDAATWLPPRKGYRCAYVARQIAVKRKYGLWVTPPEQGAIQRILLGCPGQKLPVEPPS